MVVAKTKVPILKLVIAIMTVMSCISIIGIVVVTGVTRSKATWDVYKQEAHLRGVPTINVHEFWNVRAHEGSVISKSV